VRGNEIVDKLTMDGSVQRFVGPEPFLWVSRQNIERNMKRWMEKQYLILRCRPCVTYTQAQKLISDPNLAARDRLLSSNRIQSRAVTGLLTGNNTLRTYLYIMGLSNYHTCSKRGTEEATAVRILCECEDLASLRHTLDPEDIRKLSIGTIWNFGKGTGLL
jgi:hypothetical protein